MRTAHIFSIQSSNVLVRFPCICLTPILLGAFKISKTTLTPEPDVSLKPFVLLFYEYYTDLYRMSEAEDWMQDAQRIVFMGTSFSVNITSIASRTALTNEAAIEVVDSQPIDLGYERIEYHRMTAAGYVSDRLVLLCLDITELGSWGSAQLLNWLPGI